MTQLTINVPDEKLPFFMLLAKELDFVVLDEKKVVSKLSAKQKKWIENFGTALQEAEQHATGNIKLKTAEQLLNEL
jgi:hypothetical protein